MQILNLNSLLIPVFSIYLRVYSRYIRTQSAKLLFLKGTTYALFQVALNAKMTMELYFHVFP